MAAAMAFFSPSSSCASVMASSSRLPAKASPSPSLASSRSPFFFAQGIRGRSASPGVASRRRPGRSGGLGARCLFGLGVPELVVIAGVAALVFGPKKLPEIGRSIGKTVKSFQQAAKEFETELKKDPEVTSEPPPGESTKAISSEDEKKKLETSGTKDSS